MKKSIFIKEFDIKGKVKSIKGKVIVTMNDNIKIIKGTHAVTHDDYPKKLSTHKIQSFIKEKLFESKDDILSENEVLTLSKTFLINLEFKLKELSNKEPEKTFEEKMNDLFK